MDGKIRLLGAYLPMGVLLFLAYAPWDYAMSPDTAPTTIGIRVFLSLSLLVFWLGRSSSFVRKWYDWIVATLLAVAGVGVAIILTIIPGGFATASGGIALVIMFGAGAVRMPAVHTIIVSTVICVATVVCMYSIGESTTLIGSTALMLVSFGALGVLYNASSRRDALGILISQSQLRAEKKQSDLLLRQVTTMRAERLTWLENLAHFLRHELKNQMVAMSTSIDLAQSGDSLEANRIYLDRAKRSLNRMRRLVSSATEATSLEAALASDDMQRVDFGALVADKVLTFQQLHPSRQLVLRPKPGLWVKGSEERLAQLLDKLLNNAVEHSVPQAEIRVALRRSDDEWFELTVENEGDALPDDRERMFEAFVSSQSRSENLGLGLFVAQSIARNHGGTISAEDLQDAEGARFALRLPSVPVWTNEEQRDEATREQAPKLDQSESIETDSPR